MSVRVRLALTVFLTGLAAALGVIVTVAIAFQRFEQQSVWQRGDAFLSRVAAQHDDLLDQHARNPEQFTAFLRSLLLYEPDSQLYLLDAAGNVLAGSSRMPVLPGAQVALGPVQEAVAAGARGDARAAVFVMGDDPEYLHANGVVSARALTRNRIGPGATAAGYLYLVCRRPGLPSTRLGLIGSSLASPALGGVLVVILLSSALAAWIIITVTRPLRVLSDEVARAERDGFGEGAPLPPQRDSGADDEFGRLRRGFHALMLSLRERWDELRRLDHFRRESVSNLSHDLRSPLTATVACLETLEQRWAGDPARADDRRLVEVALRNGRNAASMVRSLGDLALLDEPEFGLHPMQIDLAEMLDDIALRFAQRAAAQGVTLRFDPPGGEAPVARVDVELFERALANLIDNALKFTPSGGAIVLRAEPLDAGVRVSVADTGCGIAAAELPRLFDRLYRSRRDASSSEPETVRQGGDSGKGLGLAIVKRIVELHGGRVEVTSAPDQGTTVTLWWPA